MTMRRIAATTKTPSTKKKPTFSPGGSLGTVPIDPKTGKPHKGTSYDLNQWKGGSLGTVPVDPKTGKPYEGTSMALAPHTPASTAAPTTTTSPAPAPTPAPTPTAPSAPRPPAPGGEFSSLAALISAGYKGYTGWSETEALADYRDTGGTGKWDPEITSAEGVTDYLNAFQNLLFQDGERPEVKIPTEEELVASLTPSTPLPAPPDRLAMLDDLREEFGVTGLEEGLNTIKEEERLLLAQLKEARGIEEGKPVALGVMQGRISEMERQTQTRLDYLNIRKASAVDQLNTAYNTINTYIQFVGLDYQDAVNAYNTEFNQNLQTQQLLSGFRQEAFNNAMSMAQLGLDVARFGLQSAQFQEQIKQNNQVIAQANLTTMVNAIISGNLDFDSISEDQKLQIQKLEIQSGMPAGTISQMRATVDPMANIVYSTSNEGVTQIGWLMPDGTIDQQTYGTRISGGGTAGERAEDIKREVFGEIQQELDRLGGADKFVSPQEWDYYRRQWIGRGYSSNEYDDAFRSTYVGDPDARGFNIEEFGLE